MKTILLILFIVFVISLIWYIVTTPTHNHELAKAKQHKNNSYKSNTFSSSDSSSDSGE